MKKVKSRLYDYLLTAARRSARVRNVIYKLYHQLNLQEISRVRLLKERDKRLDTLKNQAIFSEQDYEFLRQVDYPLLWRLIRERDWRIISRISPNKTVLNGPFEGLKFPAMDIKEINLASKITGSYESELHAVVEEICRTPYQDILDVGCAEGYYAVGFARRLRQATIHAFDIDEYSREVCQNMAKINGVEDQVVLHAACIPETLMHFPYRGRTLIMADCEGYELELFAESTLPSLEGCDLLIELHDCIRPGITSAILSRFASTHHIRVISTNDRPDKEYAKLEALTPQEREAALFTHRGDIGKFIFMEWAWLVSKAPLT